ncbi:MAG: hypothetical protein AB1295_01490 [Candidatus Micrarchaeota archaeon]
MRGQAQLKGIGIAIGVLIVLAIFVIAGLGVGSDKERADRPAATLLTDCTSLKDLYVEYDTTEYHWGYRPEQFYFNEKKYSVIMPTDDGGDHRLIVASDCRIIEDENLLTDLFEGHGLVSDLEVSRISDQYLLMYECYDLEKIASESCGMLSGITDTLDSFLNHEANRQVEEHGSVLPPLLEKLEPYGWSRQATKTVRGYVTGINILNEAQPVLEVAELAACVVGDSAGAAYYEYASAGSEIGTAVTKDRRTFSNMSLVWASINEELVNAAGKDDMITTTVSLFKDGLKEGDCSGFSRRRGNIFSTLEAGTEYLRDKRQWAAMDAKNTNVYLMAHRKNAEDALQNASARYEQQWVNILLSQEYELKQREAAENLDEADQLFREQRYISAKSMADEAGQEFAGLKTIRIDLMSFEAIFRVALATAFAMVVGLAFWRSRG